MDLAAIAIAHLKTRILASCALVIGTLLILQASELLVMCLFCHIQH